MSGWLARCPAKINLGLGVYAQRPDGYHEIVTIFQAIDLEDTLSGEQAHSLSLACDDPGVPVDERNLVLRAALALGAIRKEASARGARLKLTKRIPAAGGLGGGSSDAAGAILLLEALWDLRLSPSERLSAAAAVGSDVPYFLTGGTALGTGRGESILALPAIPERAVVLGTPPFGLATAEVYARRQAPLTPPVPAVTLARLFVKFAERNDFARVTNDLEGPAFELRGELAAFRDALVRSGAEPAMVSGSGSTVFGLYRDRSAARDAAAALSGAFAAWKVVTTATVAHGVRVERSGPIDAGGVGSR